jgi:hypothetical protein
MIFCLFLQQFSSQRIRRKKNVRPCVNFYSSKFCWHAIKYCRAVAGAEAAEATSKFSPEARAGAGAAQK